MYVPIGGIDQWVQIGYSWPGLPVLLYLHGGPGGTSVPAAAASTDGPTEGDGDPLQPRPTPIAADFTAEESLKLRSSWLRSISPASQHPTRGLCASKAATTLS